MPQYDISTYSSQIFWLFVCIMPIFLILTYFLLPKLKNVLDERSKITSEKRKEIEKMNVEISQIEQEIQVRMHKSFQKIKKLKEEREFFIHNKIREELNNSDEELAIKKNEFIESMNLFKNQISKNIDDGIINYSQILIKKVSSFDANTNKLTEIFNNIKA
jgi:F-type H+-transporting ATPase subunit b